MKSKPYKLNGKLFRYDFDSSLVEYVEKADAETLADEAEWKKNHEGRSLYGIGEDGYMVLATVGLRSSNWKDRAERDEYLACWVDELDEESAGLVSDFLKYG